MNMDEWLDYGIEQGFCSGPACNTHDGVEETDEEKVSWEAGEDPCQQVVRLWQQNG